MRVTVRERVDRFARTGDPAVVNGLDALREATELLRDFPGLSVTRLASGLPMGGDLEFADELTLGRAMSGRRVV